jgi:hypothetical protein
VYLVIDKILVDMLADLRGCQVEEPVLCKHSLLGNCVVAGRMATVLLEDLILEDRVPAMNWVHKHKLQWVQWLML